MCSDINKPQQKATIILHKYSYVVDLLIQNCNNVDLVDVVHQLEN